METALDILKRFWGFESFRKKQDKIIECILNKQDTLALLPTGGGKSVCFQVPALMKEGICLVVSPLIALMQDQVAQLNKRGIKAIAITSGMSYKEIDIQLDNAIYGQTKFLYVSPERLSTRLFQTRLEKMNVNLIAIDEAHCISEWGYDFRPAYLKIVELKKIKPDVPFLALTATATNDVVIDIQQKLQFKEENLLSDSFERSNLIYNVQQSNNKLNRILEYLGNTKESGIIYCSTRKDVKNLCKTIRDQGISVNFYHGGVDFETRKERQNLWLKGDTQVMVCTNAFGMGIDKPNVRFVLHYDIPDSIEAYFQEAGRAGRDGDTAEAVLFYEPADIEKLKEKVRLKYPALEDIKKIYSALGNYFQLAIGSGKEESFRIDLLDFCDRYKLDLITVFNSLKFLEIGGFIGLSENYHSSSKVKFLINNKALYQFQVKDEKANRVTQFLLRTQMGIFEDLAPINEAKISKYCSLPIKEVIQVLASLDKQEAISYVPQSKGTYLTYLTERLVDSNLSLPVEIYHKRKETSIKKMESMIEFLISPNCCQQFLLQYFGEMEANTCQKCNRCKTLSNSSHMTDLKKDIEDYIDSHFKSNEQLNIQDIISEFNSFPKEDILTNIRWMIDHEMLRADPLGKTLLQP